MDDGAFNVSDRSYTRDVASAAIRKEQGRKEKDNLAVQRFKQSSVKAAAPLQLARQRPNWHIATNKTARQCSPIETAILDT